MNPSNSDKRSLLSDLLTRRTRGRTAERLVLPSVKVRRALVDGPVPEELSQAVQLLLLQTGLDEAPGVITTSVPL
jgi:hypothetical protein